MAISIIELKHKGEIIKFKFNCDTMLSVLNTITPLEHSIFTNLEAINIINKICTEYRPFSLRSRIMHDYAEFARCDMNMGYVEQGEELLRLTIAKKG